MTVRLATYHVTEFCCLICIIFHVVGVVVAVVVVFQQSLVNDAVRSFDCILVAQTVEDGHSFKKKQEAYIKELKSKNLKVTVSSQSQPDRAQEMSLITVLSQVSTLLPTLHSQEVRRDDKIFYGIQAPEEIFNKYKYLLKVSDACNWSAEPGDCVQNTTR